MKGPHRLSCAVAFQVLLWLGEALKEWADRLKSCEKKYNPLV